MSNNVNPAQFGEQFGMSRREQSEIHGKAIAEHLWEGAENIFGPMRVHARMQAADHLNAQFPGHRLKVDEDNNPYHAVKHGDWEGRYFGGPHIEMHHRRHGAQEVIDVTDKHGEPTSFNHDHMHNVVKHFAVHDGPQYVEAARPYRGR